MPFARLRRLRKNPQLRALFAETNLRAKDLILPYFVVEGRNKKERIPSMPGICRFSSDRLIRDVAEAAALGVKAVLLFGIPVKKSRDLSQSYSEGGAAQRAIRAIRRELPDNVIMTDVCLCAYTEHGHCGVVKNRPQTVDHRPKTKKEKFIDNDETVKVLTKIAISHAEAGADFVGPSAMMDGQVLSIREGLDRRGFTDAGILAYSAKFASNFYGPFRDVMESAPRFGDRKSYQIDFRNSDEALREIGEDIKEGADIVMVKPALAYLDIISRAKDRFNIPIAAYNVSGEYSMIQKMAGGDKAAEKQLVIETLTSIKRAGADFIITYFAKEAAGWLR